MQKMKAYSRILFIIFVASFVLLSTECGAKMYMGTINLELGKTAKVDSEPSTNFTVAGSWSKSGDAVSFTARSDRYCKISAVKIGTATLEWAGLINTTWTEMYWTINVSPAPVLVTSIKLNKESLSLEPKEEEQLIETVLPTNATDKSVTWSSSKSGIATVSNTGIVTAIAEGTVTITCKANDGSGKSATCTVTVSSPVVAEINATNFPDEAFRNYLLSQSYGIDGKLTKSEIEDVTKLNVSGDWSARGNIKNLLGIGFFSELRELYCSSNQITTIDMSKNTELVNLSCGYNPLVSLDVSKCTKLESIDVFSTDLEKLDLTNNILLSELVLSGNSIASLNLSYNTRLTKLSCSGKSLQSIDLSKNTMLTDVNFYSASLKSLDLSNCSRIENLRCEYGQLERLLLSPECKLKSFWMERNRINGKAMDDLINSLPVNPTGEPYTFRVLVVENASLDNVCTTAQVAAAKAKGWTPLRYSDGSWVEYGGSNDASGINDVVTDAIDSNAPIYNLRGQRLAAPQNGINIIGGKKVLVK